MSQRIAIVGAGISGCVLARTLMDAGFKVTVFEKSGGTGGRLSTRRSDIGSFDHGAQYISAKSPGFRAMLTGLASAGSVSLWEPERKDRGAEWHIGSPGMSGLVKPLIEGVDVRLRHHVESVVVDQPETALLFRDHEQQRFDRVILAVPTPQAAALTGNLGAEFQPLATVGYVPCWTLMLGFDEPLLGVPDFWRGSDLGAAMSWMARERSKYAQAHGAKDRFVIQAGGHWSRSHLEDDRCAVSDAMVEAFQSRFGAKQMPVHAVVHRWLYAHVETPFGKPFLAGCDNRVIIAGDGMVGPRAEAAFESARATCEFVKTLY